MLEKLSSKSLFSRTTRFNANDSSMQMRSLNLKLPNLCFAEKFGRTYQKVRFAVKLQRAVALCRVSRTACDVESEEEAQVVGCEACGGIN